VAGLAWVFAANLRRAAGPGALRATNVAKRRIDVSTMNDKRVQRKNSPV